MRDTTVESAIPQADRLAGISTAPKAQYPGLNRRSRRRLARQANSKIRKGVPFGRCAVLSFEDDPMDAGNDRVRYLHATKGELSRRITDNLLFALCNAAG